VAKQVTQNLRTKVRPFGDQLLESKCCGWRRPHKGGLFPGHGTPPREPPIPAWRTRLDYEKTKPISLPIRETRQGSVFPKSNTPLNVNNTRLTTKSIAQILGNRSSVPTIGSSGGCRVNETFSSPPRFEAPDCNKCGCTHARVVQRLRRKSKGVKT
jgi:hypothetical protein